MKKLKLDIQRFASTNKTTHYELNQYIGSDKPTYLVDYNQDMSKIDAGIYGADAKAVENATNIGDLSQLTTTDKLSLVNAINEVNSESSSVGDLQDLTTTSKTNVVSAINEVNGKASSVGDLTNLTTTDKTSIVNAVNEVNAKSNTIGNLTNLSTTDKTSVVAAVNEVNGKADTNTQNLTIITGEVNELEGKILWTNPNPTSTFNEQNIVLSSSDYDILEFYFKNYKSVDRLNTSTTLKGYGTELIQVTTDAPYIQRRLVNYVNDTTFTIKNFEGSVFPGNTANDYIIPVYVIGHTNVNF